MYLGWKLEKTWQDLESSGLIKGDYRLHCPLLMGSLLSREAETELTCQPLPTEGAMRASETVSEASPSSTASQTGVPTQVVQQVQSSQQVGRGLHGGGGAASR